MLSAPLWVLSEPLGVLLGVYLFRVVVVILAPGVTQDHSGGLRDTLRFCQLAERFSRRAQGHSVGAQRHTR